MWVGSVEFKPAGRKADGGVARVEFEARKVVGAEVGPRLFMDRTPRLPYATPDGLRELRDRELSIIQARRTLDCLICADQMRHVSPSHMTYPRFAVYLGRERRMPE